MRLVSPTLAACAVFSVSAGIAFAQDAMQGQEMPDLPKACQTGKAPAMPGMMESMESAMQGMDQAHQDFMQGMMATHEPMMEGMMAEDRDIAFACGMIPHHQAAINMAKTELQYGDNDWAKQKAQQIIDAQEKEIAELKAFIEDQAQ